MDNFYQKILEKINMHVIVKNKNNNIIYKNIDEAIKLSDFNINKLNKIDFDNHTYYVSYLEFDNDNIIETYQDISQYNKEIFRLKRDYLTNLFNRHAIFEKLELINNDAINKKTNYAVVIGDIDLFKEVNDKYGHLVGDKVLKGISDIMIKSINDLGLVGRFGGEEFIIILPNTTKENALNLIEKLRKDIESTKVKVKYNDCIKEFNISITFGISMSSKDKSTVELIEEVDKALYRGKKNGRNQTNCF